ncbi:hypothetical protein RB195_003193 [Necator americanus]|uniref:Uncharacterized protein n=1 Tax=Necator americanus TaxID=51031 RepID=A0ABR1DMF3_NECAM
MNRDIVLILTSFFVTSVFLNLVIRSSEDADKATPKVIAFSHKRKFTANFDEIIEQIESETLQTAPFIAEHLVPPFYNYWEAPKDYRCYGCNENLNCFVERLYKTLWEAYNSQMTEYDFDLAHFAPQTWYCQYRTNLNNYVLVDYSTETEELVRQLDLVYERAGVPQSYRVVIASEIRRQKSNNSTSQTSDRASVERHLLIDEKTYRRLVQIYYYDFVVFGYSLPTFL